MPSTPSPPTRRRVLASAATAATVGTAGCLGSLGADDNGAGPSSTDGQTDWPTAGHDGANTNAVSGAVTPTAGLEERWRAAVGTVTAQPVVVDGMAYAVAGDLMAFDADSGERRWTVSVEEGQGRFWAAPTVADGVVYVSNGHRRVRALDAETGENLWTTEMDVGTYATPRIDSDGETLFVGGGGHVSALEAETGDVEWTHELFGQVRHPLADHRAALYALTEGGELYAFDRYGDGYWRVDLPAKSQCAPTVGDRLVYVGTFDGYVHAIDPTRASIEWSTEVGGFAKGGIAVDDDRVYVDGGRELHALAADSGDRAWTFDIGTTGDHQPVVVDDTVYTTGDRLYALQADGGFSNGVIRRDITRFTHETGGYAGALSVADGRLYVAARLDDTEGNQTTALLALEPS